ncbi:MAG: hypothetical protein ISP91_17505 [Pseudomonadales bacterium]|nr:hypothetical protein [Pseudomonadales bacterium]
MASSIVALRRPGTAARLKAGIRLITNSLQITGPEWTDGSCSAVDCHRGGYTISPYLSAAQWTALASN